MPARRGCPRARASRCCAGSPSRSTACAASLVTRGCGDCSLRLEERRCRAAMLRVAHLRGHESSRCAWRSTRATMRRRELAGGGQQPFAAARSSSTRRLVVLADHARRRASAPVVELLLQLVLDELALLLDHEDLLQSVRERAHALGLERPGHRDLEEADADLARDVARRCRGPPAPAARRVRLAGGDDAEARAGRIDQRCG